MSFILYNNIVQPVNNLPDCFINKRLSYENNDMAISVSKLKNSCPYHPAYKEITPKYC